MNSTITSNDSHYRKLEQFQDRCDSCSAQAFARAIMIKEDGLLELLFCGHHLKKNYSGLDNQGWLIQDDTNKINLKPSDFEE